jgi:antitoxin component of MazEF toxin-antitoxin module
LISSQNYIGEITLIVFMCHVAVEIRKWGNALGEIIPKDKVVELGLSEKDIIDIDILKKEKVSGFGISKRKKPFEREESEHEDLW